MNKATSLVLVSAGLVWVGIAYVMVASGPNDQRRLAPQQSDAVTSPTESDAMRAAAAGAWRSLPRAETPSGPAERPTATVVVTVPTVKAPGELPQKATSIAGDRGSLARDLQRELRRVGCYDGEINGAWTTSTRQAMKAFTDRVNATLPIKEPDAVLLALVQGHQYKACGTPCPAGQGLAEDGRCMPNAVLAHAARKDPKRSAAMVPLNTSPSADQTIPAMTGWSTTTTVAATLPSSLADEQMALAGPKAEIDAVAPNAEPVQPARGRPPETRRKVSGDWRAELWKKQAN